MELLSTTLFNLLPDNTYLTSFSRPSLVTLMSMQ